MSENINWVELLSALATTGAVVVAMCAIKSENKHRNEDRRRADRLRQDDLEQSIRERARADSVRKEDLDMALRERARADRIRQEDLDAALLREQEETRRVQQAERSRARRLAKIFDRELTEAARHLVTIGKLLERLSPESVPDFVEIYGKPLDPNVFKMHERFVDQLDVFPDMLAISIVNNMTNWSSIPLFSEGLDKSPNIQLMRIRHKLLADIEQRVALFGETKEQLFEYFSDLPGLQMRSFDEIRAMNEASAEKRRSKDDGRVP